MKSLFGSPNNGIEETKIDYPVHVYFNLLSLSGF